MPSHEICVLGIVQFRRYVQAAIRVVKRRLERDLLESDLALRMMRHLLKNFEQIADVHAIDQHVYYQLIQAILEYLAKGDRVQDNAFLVQLHNYLRWVVNKDVYLVCDESMGQVIRKGLAARSQMHSLMLIRLLASRPHINQRTSFQIMST